MMRQTLKNLAANLPAYARLTRVSNLPTITSNTLVGCMIAVGTGTVPWWRLFIVDVALSALYLAGMALNDLVDANIDECHQPQRPIPSGQVSVRSVYGFVFTATLLALVLLAFLGWSTLLLGLGLTASIVGYNLWHQRGVGAVVLMGLCRAGVYLVAASACTNGGQARSVHLGTLTMYGDNPVLWEFCGLIAAYTIVLSLIAKDEVCSEYPRRRWRIVLPPLTILIGALSSHPHHWWWATVLGVVVLGWFGWATWLLYTRTAVTQRVVMMGLAGFCLLDAFFLALLDRPAIAMIASVCFLITVSAHRRIMGT